MKTITLSNGLEVLIVPPAHKDVAAAILLTRTGSRYETSDTNGLARFCALMSMKKTEDFPTQMALLEAIDTHGLYVNVETNREYTALYTKSYAPNFHEALHVLSQMTIHQVFDRQDIENEKRYFQTEIANRQNDIQGTSLDELFRLIFKGHPIAYSGVGDKDAVSLFGENTLHDYRNQHYTAQNSLIVVCADTDTIEADLETFFAGLPAGERIESEQVQFDMHGEKEGFVSIESPNGAVALGFPAYSRNTAQKYEQLLLEILLGKTKSNMRLNPIFQEERLAQSIGTGLYQFSDVGLFVIQMMSPAAQIQRAHERVLEEVEKITLQPVSDEELQKAKGYYAGLLMLGLNDPVERAFFYGLQKLLEADVVDEKAFLERLNAVDAEAIYGVSQAILDMGNMHTVRVGGA